VAVQPLSLPEAAHIDVLLAPALAEALPIISLPQLIQAGFQSHIHDSRLHLRHPTLERSIVTTHVDGVWQLSLLATPGALQLGPPSRGLRAAILGVFATASVLTVPDAPSSPTRLTVEHRGASWPLLATRQRLRIDLSPMEDAPAVSTPLPEPPEPRGPPNSMDLPPTELATRPWPLDHLCTVMPPDYWLSYAAAIAGEGRHTRLPALAPGVAGTFAAYARLPRVNVHIPLTSLRAAIDGCFSALNRLGGLPLRPDHLPAARLGQRALLLLRDDLAGYMALAPPYSAAAAADPAPGGPRAPPSHS